MKKLLMSVLLSGFAVAAYPQGFISLDNNLNGGALGALTGGRFFVDGVATVGDFNAAFYGGTDSANLSLIASFAGAAAAHSGDFGAGTWTDPTGNSYAIAGSGATAFFRIDSWTGNATDYASATTKGSSGVFNNPVAAPPATPPDFTSMPSVNMTSVPEPGTFALAGLGAAALLIFRRRK